MEGDVEVVFLGVVCQLTMMYTTMHLSCLRSLCTRETRRRKRSLVRVSLRGTVTSRDAFESTFERKVQNWWSLEPSQLHVPNGFRSRTIRFEEEPSMFTSSSSCFNSTSRKACVRSVVSMPSILSVARSVFFNFVGWFMLFKKTLSNERSRPRLHPWRVRLVSVGSNHGNIDGRFPNRRRRSGPLHAEPRVDRTNLILSLNPTRGFATGSVLPNVSIVSYLSDPTTSTICPNVGGTDCAFRCDSDLKVSFDSLDELGWKRRSIRATHKRTVLE